MANSGSITTNTAFGYVKLSWSESSQDITNNKTTISYTLMIHRDYSISSSASKSYSIVINGSTVASGTTTIGGSGDKTIKTGTTTITHNADGTKTFSYSFSQQIDINWGGSWIGTVTGSGSGTLDTIPRATQPTLPDAYIYCGDPMVINTPRASTSFTHTLTYSFGASSGTIATSVGTTYTWTVPLSLLNQIPNDTSGSGTITCKTYNGSTLIGTKSVTMYLYAKSDVVPTFTSVTATDTNTAVTSLAVGSYVQGLSKPKFTANGFAGAYGSTISKYEFTFEGVTFSSGTTNNYTMTTAIKGSGTITVTAKVTDSRGRTASKTLNLTVLAYAPPVITAFAVQRANADGTLNDMGTYAKVTHNGSFNTLNAKNTLTVNTYAKLRGTSDWGTAIKTFSGLATTPYNGAFTSTQVYDATKSYDFRVDFVDKFNTTLSVAVMSTGLVTMSWAPGGIGVGKVWQSGALDVYGDVNIEGTQYIKAGGKIVMPANQYASGTSGAPLDMLNSDIVGINNIYMSDTATSSSEAIQFRKSTTPAGSFASGDWDSFRVYDGIGYLNDVPIFSSFGGDLWEGGYYMNENQTATPTKRIDACPNGWVLAWSDYNASTATVNDTDFSLSFIHKSWVKQFSGKTMPVVIPNYFNLIVIKYLVVYLDKITGSSWNDDGGSGTAPYNYSVDSPQDVVLRRIYEW